MKGFISTVFAVALLLSLGLFATAAHSWHESVDEKVDTLKAKQIEAVQGSLKIKSYNHGSETTPAEGVKEVLDYVLNLAEEMGMRTYKHPGYRYGWVEIGEPARKEMIMVLGHLDTVPEGNLADWTKAGPFEGKIVDGEIIGRGATDDKGPSVSALFALKAIKESGVDLGRRIRVFFGTSEDGSGLDKLGWSCVAEYAKRCQSGEEEWPVLGFSPDSDNFAVTYIEKSSVNTNGNVKLEPQGDTVLTFLKGGTATNAVSDFCSAVITAPDPLAVKSTIEAAIAGMSWKGDVSFSIDGNKLSFDVKGVAAHSGQAWKGKSANMRALYMLSNIKEGSWRETAEKLVKLVGVDTADGEGLGIKQGGNEHDDIITTNMGLLGYKPDENVLTFSINTRYPDSGADLLVPEVKHLTGAEIKAKVAAAFENAGFDVGEGQAVTVGGGAKPYTIPWDSEIVTKLRAAYKSATGKDKSPMIVYGGTYASAWRNEKLSPNSDEVFGFRMAAWGLEAGGKGHSPNEFINIDNMIAGTKIMARAMASLANAVAIGGG